MTYNEARLLVNQAIDAMEQEQIKAGNKEYKHAYIVGALTAVISTAIATESTGEIIRFLNNQLNNPRNYGNNVRQPNCKPN